MTHPPVVLSIAGTDSGGAAGTVADVTTVAAHGAHAACVVTAVTAQDTTGVHAVHPVPAEMVAAQLEAVLADLPVAAVKTGMLGSPEVVALVADRLAGRVPLVVDPVLVATSGAELGGADVVAAYREHLLPAATVLTPNADEAATLLDDPAPAPAPGTAARLSAAGCAVLLTGGPDADPTSSPETCTDWLAVPGEDPVPVEHPAVPTGADHGTGCTHSAALAARLARGEDLLAAARGAAEFTTRQLTLASTWSLGRGRGPVAHVLAHETDPMEET